jgi:uncharacterized protein (TIGR01244 family)
MWKGVDMRMQTRFLTSLATAALAAAIATAGEVEAIDQFHRISDRVATGAQPTPAQVTALSDEGFAAIVNLREESEFNDGPQARAARDAGMAFVRIPISSQKPADAAVEKFLAATDDDALYPVFIYCASANRATALWMIRRVLREGWTLADAEAEAVRAGLRSATMLDFTRDYVRRHAGNERKGL